MMQQAIQPVLVNGEIGNEDWDHYKFRANAGQKMIFDVSATRHGSRLDADVALLDERGEELAWVDDTTIFGDPHLEYTFAKSGDYVVRVGSLNGGGNYRLSAGVLPYARRTFPAGLEAGKPTVITFTGSRQKRSVFCFRPFIDRMCFSRLSSGGVRFTKPYFSWKS